MCVYVTFITRAYCSWFLTISHFPFHSQKTSSFFLIALFPWSQAVGRIGILCEILLNYIFTT